MSSQKSTAIIVRVVEFSESSCIVTMFTRDYGKLSAMAKGARRPKSPFDSAIDLLSLCRIVFLHKSSDALDLLTEAKLERRFRAGSRDLSRLYAGYYVAELLNKLTDEGDPHQELFDVACRTLLSLADDVSVTLALLHFELTALRLLGHLPSLTECVGCGNPVMTEQRVAFGQIVGGVLCEICRVGKRQVVRVSSPGMRLMRTLVSAQHVGDVNVDEHRRAIGEVRGVVSGYVCSLIGHRPQMHDYLGIE